MTNKLVKEQFNKQAEKFANWSVGKNVDYLNAYFGFLDLKGTDRILDVACGPGEFMIYIANRVSEVRGIDISDKEIEIANNLVKEFGLNNVRFDCQDVESLPYVDNSFSVIVCKSAFHHLINPDAVFKEMIRCCEKGGLISIQDIRAYENDYVNEFFETFDKLVDVSHNRTLSEKDFNKLYLNNRIKKTGEFKLDVDLNVKEYIDHAIQDEENTLRIRELLDKGQSEIRLKNYLFKLNGELFFKRPVYLIKGIK